MGSTSYSKAEAKYLRQRTLNGAQSICRSSLEFARALYEVKTGVLEIGKGEMPLYEAWDFESWEDYVERELEYHKGTADAYVRIHHTFFVKFAGMWTADLMPKSITKLRALSKVVLASNINSWFRRASSMTCCELEDVVESSMTGAQRRGRMRTLHVPLSSKELMMVNNAVVRMREETGIVKRGAALAKVCEQWREMDEKMQRRPKSRVA